MHDCRRGGPALPTIDPFLAHLLNGLSLSFSGAPRPAPSRGRKGKVRTTDFPAPSWTFQVRDLDGVPGTGRAASLERANRAKHRILSLTLLSYSNTHPPPLNLAQMAHFFASAFYRLSIHMQINCGNVNVCINGFLSARSVYT